MLSCLEIRGPRSNRRGNGYSSTKEQKQKQVRVKTNMAVTAAATAACAGLRSTQCNTTTTSQQQIEIKMGAVRISNDRYDDRQESRLEFSPYTNCWYTRGRGCHVGSGTGNHDRSLRYSVGPALRGYARVGRRAVHWSTYYDNYDDEYLYEHCVVPKEERNNHYSNLSKERRWSLYGS